MTIEQWKSVVGYEGHYDVSNHGRIWSHKNQKVLVNKASGNSRYLSVGLYIEGQLKRKNIHRMVAEAFIGPCPDGFEVCHNDGNARNNHASNLRYDTRKNNHKDKLKHGTALLGEQSSNAKLQECDVKAIRAFKGIFLQQDIAETFGISIAQVSRIMNLRRWAHV